MRSHLISLLSLGSLAAASPLGPIKRSCNAAAYFLENDPAGSHVVTLEIGSDGMLSNPKRVATGGKGLISLNATSDKPVPADSLMSQGSMVVKDNLLFTLNAGSNTVSMFFINPNDPTELKRCGGAVDTMGDFPNSLDYSPELNQLCVLNGGAKAGVACFTVDFTYGLTPAGAFRALGPSIISQTTPPAGPPGTASQLSFNQDSTAVLATIKGVPGSIPGSVVVYPVINNLVAETPATAAHFSNILIDFGFSWLTHETFLLSDPSFGASILRLHHNMSVTQESHTPIAGQGAICWTAYDHDLRTAYAIDAGTNNLYKIDPHSGKYLGNIEVQLPGGGMGVFDNAIYDHTLYGLAGTPGVVVVDLKTQKQKQYLDLSSFGDRQYFDGFAVWPAQVLDD